MSGIVGARECESERELKCESESGKRASEHESERECRARVSTRARESVERESK